MIPKSLSATSVDVYEDCPKRWEVEYLNKAPSPSGSAADLGTACHGAIELFVVGNQYLLDAATQRKSLAVLFKAEYEKIFPNTLRLAEGQKIMTNWLARQDFSDRTVLSCERKLNFDLKTSAGVIPFNYIMDRMDRRADGSIEVIDYKSFAQPIQPDDVRHKIQARCYALAAQLMFPEQEFIRVTFDLLRYDQVGTIFTKDENRETYKYLLRLAERIIADNEPLELLGDGCRWCMRKHACGTLSKHIHAGGVLAITDPVAAALKRHELDIVAGALKTMIADLDEVIIGACNESGSTSLDAGELMVELGSRKSRDVDPMMAGRVIGADLMLKYGKLNITTIDALLKGDELTDAQKEQLRKLIFNGYGRVTVKTKVKAKI